MSNYTEKAQLIGGADIVYLDRASVRAYREVQNEYSHNILGTTLSFRFSNSLTQAQETRFIIINNVSIVAILQDMMEIYEIPDDSTSPRFLDARIDDSRILITLIHDSYDTLEILAQEVTEQDAINHLHLHPTPHPSGISRVGQVRMSTSNKQNRALNAGAFLVRGEDRTSTGINRVLSKLADNVDLVENRTRRSRRGDVQRLLNCSIEDGVVGLIKTTLVGDEVLTATPDRQSNSLPAGDTDEVYLQALFTMSKDAETRDLTLRTPYDFILGEEDTSSQYVFNTTAGRTSPSAQFDYSFIALSEAGRDTAIATLSTPGSTHNLTEIDADPDYYTVADWIGTIYGPKYRTRTADDEYVSAEVIDFFTFRFSARLESLSFVNQGDIIILPQGVFEVDFVGDDNRTVGIRSFGGNFAEVFNLDVDTANRISEIPMPSTLTPNTELSEVILVKSGIGVKGEHYGVGRFGHNHSPLETIRRFRIRTLVRDISTTAKDDTALRKVVHELQGALDPYSDKSSYSITTSLRAINAVGGVLKLPKLYSVPESTHELYKLDYLMGSHSYGPLRVSPSQYAVVPSKLSIFSGIGGWRNAPDSAALLRTKEAYFLAEYSISNDEVRSTLLTFVDAALLEGDWGAAKKIEQLLYGLPELTVSGQVLPTAFRQNSPEEREDVVDFFREVMQIGGRSLVYNGTPAELDPANGLTIKLTDKGFFSEADVGRVFIISLPMIPKIVQERPQTSLLPPPAYSQTREVRVRMHTWTSPKSARFIPIDGMEFYLHREFSITISPSLGYANIGYGAFTNSIIPTEHKIKPLESPVSRLTEGTEYRHIYPGNISYLDVDTPFTTSLRTYSHLYYVVGSDEVGAYLPAGASAGADQRIDLFPEERSLLLLSESFVTLAGIETSVAGAHPQDGRLDLNHSNRVYFRPLSQLTFLPFLRSSDQHLQMRSDDFLFYALQALVANNPATSGGYADLVAFSPNVYQSDVTVAAAAALQQVLCGSLASLRGSDLTGEYNLIPTDGTSFTPVIPRDYLGYIKKNVDGQLTRYNITYDEFIVSLYEDDVILEIERGAGGVRPEDTALLKDVYRFNPHNNTQVPLNCEDLLVHGTINSKASLGHVRDFLNENVYQGTRLTSNRILLALEAEDNPESLEVINAIENAYGSSSTDTGTLVQYVGLETIDTTHAFTAPFSLSVDSDGVGRLTIEETPGSARKVPRKTRSWFKLTTTRADGSTSGITFFAFDNRGKIRQLSEYAQSGDATSSVYGSFEGGNLISGQPRWEGLTWDVIASAPADITRIQTIELSGVIDTFAVHSVLKSADIPYYLTAHVKSAARVAPVSKELGKTLSSVITEQSALASLTPLEEFDPFEATLFHENVDNRLLLSNAYPSVVRTESGRVEKVTFDSAHSSGMDINIYDGDTLTTVGRDDGVRMSSFTRGYTDTLPNTVRTSRKRNTLHVQSEEMISGARITHRGIETTMFLDTLIPTVTDLNVYTPLAHAGLIVDLTDARAWSGDSSYKHGISDPSRLVSPLDSSRRLIEVDNSSDGDVSIPLLAAAKLISSEAIGLYVNWVGRTDQPYDPDEFPESGASSTVPIIHLTTPVDNASILVEGEQDISASLSTIGAPLLDRDGARSAVTAFGPINTIGTLRVVGDLRCTRYADENIGDGHNVLAGLRGHLNPITAPRAQNYYNSLYNLAQHKIVVTESHTTVRDLALQNLPTAIGNPSVDDSVLVAGDNTLRANRNPDGKSQQQLGERHNIIKYEYSAFYPSADTHFLVQREPEGQLAQFFPVGPNELYDEGLAVSEIEPTYFIGVGERVDSGDVTLTEARYYPLALGLYQPSQVYGDELNGYRDEYLLLVMPRNIMSFGESYLGRTVTLELNRLIPYYAVTGSSTTQLAVPVPTAVSAVIADIEDSPNLGVTFIKLVATLDRFDSHQSVMVGTSPITTGPSSFSESLTDLYSDGFITSLNKDAIYNHVPETTSIDTWEDLWANDTLRNKIAYGSTYTALQHASAPDASLGQLQINITVHGREWVLNAYQAYISDKLRLLNDLGGDAEIYLKRDKTLVIKSEQTDIYADRDVNITSSLDDVNVSAAQGEVTVTATAGSIILPDRTIGFADLASKTGYLTVTVESYYASSSATDWYDTLLFFVDTVYGISPYEQEGLVFPVEEKFVFKSNSNVVSFITVEKSDPNMPDFEAYFDLGAIPMERGTFDGNFVGANYIKNIATWKAMCSSIAIVGPPGATRKSYRLLHPSVHTLTDNPTWPDDSTWGLNNRHISVERILPSQTGFTGYTQYPTFEPVETAYRLDDMTDDTTLTNRPNHKYRIQLPDIGSGVMLTPTDQVVFQYSDPDFTGSSDRTDDVLDILAPSDSNYQAPTFTVNRKRIRYTLNFAVQYGEWESYARRQFSGIYQRSNRVRGWPTITNFGFNTFLNLGGSPPEWP